MHSKIYIVPLLLLMTALPWAFAQDIRVDGSSTVYPISLALAEDFQIVQPGARITVAFSGTGAGFEKFCRGETDVSGASRVIKQGEIDLCEANGIEFVEVPVAADGLSLVANPENDWIDCLTVEELNRIWRPESDVDSWSDVRDGLPDREIILYGPGTDSGTFDYFTEAINGDSGAIRTDFFPSEDDNVLVQGVSGDAGALGFFGFAYYIENRQQLKLLAVDGGNGCVEPSKETIAANEYVPLSRPMFLYFNAEHLDSNDALLEFAEYVVSPDAEPLIADTGYLAYPAEVYDAAAERIDQRVTGSAFQGFEPGDSVLEAVRQSGE